MNIEIKEASPKAMQTTDVAKPNSTSYPFDKLELGQCFTIVLSEANVKSLRTIASRKSKGGKKFVVVEHVELNLCEVARTV